MWLIDPKTKTKSVTLTFFALGFTVAVVKLAISGVSIAGFQVEQFSGVDFAAVVGALGGVYALRRTQKGVEADATDLGRADG